MREIQLPYAIKDGELIHISQVESGLVCDCVCPSCSATLVAKKGEEVEHHFSHYAADACSTALETALHLAAKEVLKAANRIALPAVIVDFSSGFREIELAESKAYQFDSVRAEKKIGEIIPDLILDVSGHQLLVEVFATHRVDNEKLRRINELGISAIEIDLSSVPRDLPMKALSELIIDGVDNKKWLNNERVNVVYKDLMRKTARRKIETLTKWNVSYIRGVKRCPEFMRRSKNNRNWRIRVVNSDKASGEAKAEDCLQCKYCLGTKPESSGPAYLDYIYCIGHIPDALDEYKLGPTHRTYGSKEMGGWSSY